MTKIVAKVKEGAKPGWGGFLGWLAKVHPGIYNNLRVNVPEFVSAVESDHSTGSVVLPGLSGDGAIAPAASAKVQQVIDTVIASAGAILPLVQQQKILKVQLERAKAGLPPLDVAAYADPNQGLNVGLNPATRNTLLWLGGGALVGLVLLTARKRR